jgi:hypothetical protein
VANKSPSGFRPCENWNALWFLKKSVLTKGIQLVQTPGL